MRGGKSTLTHLRIVRVVFVSFPAIWVGVGMMMSAELLFWVIIHHINFLKVDLFLFEDVAAGFADNAMHIPYPSYVLADQGA